MGRLITGGRCPKCGGNLYMDRDYIGWYEQCLQCGYMNDLGVVYQNKKKTPGNIAEPVPVKSRDYIEKKDNT
jgi:Zn ribbon nucleic-acid-binding protein